MSIDPKNVQSIAEQIKHELDIVLTDETMAFFSVTFNTRLLGDDYLDIIPTFTIIHSQLTRGERLRIADGISRLAKDIRSSALSNRYDDDGPKFEENDQS